MKTKLLALLVLIVSCRPSFAANYVFDYNARCHSAYQHYMALDLDKGTSIIRQELMANPYNLMATYLADYEDCLLLMMNGDSRDLEQRDSHLEERLKLISLGDERSPWYRLCKAGLYFHWALVHVRFGENLKAGTTFRKSFLLLKENRRLFPGFPQNKIFLGVEEAVVGTIPGDYKWLASIFGMRGNVRRGISQLNSFINTADVNAPLREEAIIYSCYLRFYLLSQQQEVWDYVNSTRFPAVNNLFYSFVKANLALNFRKADIALEVLEDARAMEHYKRFPILDYELGSALLHKLDGKAIIYFNKFLSRYTGRFFVKDTYQKLAYAAYIQQNMEKAGYYRKQILSSGSKQVDADKQAQRFATGTAWPSMAVLQARLLTDGGYYYQALQKLQFCDVQTLAITDKLEYYFRLARIHDELGQEDKAILFYQTTIRLGRSRQEQFAARSALQMGMLYERTGRTADAIRCYNESLSMKDHDFRSSIEQQAKAGINRLTLK